MGKSGKRPWTGRGDIAAFFALMPDNLATLAIMAALLTNFGVPGSIVFGKMIPGTALGVMVGDLIYTWMALRLAKKENRQTVCAVPLGVDTPSSIGIVVCVLGPAFVQMKQGGMDATAAGMSTWHLGLATMLLIGVFKALMSFCGGWIQRKVPQAALLGSLGGVGIAFIGFMQLAELFTVPVAGMASLAIVFFVLIARMRLFAGVPGVLTAVVVGSVLYHGMGVAGLNPGIYSAPPVEFYFHLPEPTLGGLGHLGEALKYITVSLPFAILSVIGGINVTASAHAEGHRYNTRSVLMAESFSTIVAGFFGGVAQTVPYAGFPAYRRMGARAGYTLAVGLFIGLGGILGFVSFIVELIPAPVLAPILVFMAVEVVSQPYTICRRRYSAAILAAMLPALARMVMIYLSDPSWMAPERIERLINTVSHSGFSSMAMMVAMGNGFILTGMLWGGFLSNMVDHKFSVASRYLLICALLSFSGVIHSPYADGRMVLPWLENGVMRQIPLQFTAAYIVAAVVIFGLSRLSAPEALNDAGRDPGFSED
jgi:adenine/guanine/hypoxanthine permease